MTLAFLENQLASTLTLQSAQEYRYWLLIYARFLVNEGTKLSLRQTSVGGWRLDCDLNCDLAFHSRLRVSSQRTLQGAPGSRPQISSYFLGGHHTGTTSRCFTSSVL